MTADETTRIAVLGTGLMGAPMARRLLLAGHPVTVWNRTPEKAASLVQDGARGANSPEQAVTGAGVVVSMLSDGAATGALLDRPGLIPALAPNAIWLDMCSARPEDARAQAARLAEAGIRHLDAPVSGGTKGAEAGTLAIMAGGDADTFAAAAPYLAAMGRPVHVGPTGAGQLAKLANQAIVGVTIGAVAEAMLLLQRGGADPAAVRAALRGGFADSTILQQHGARMTEGDFTPGGPSRLQVKDLDNVLAEAAALGLTLPATATIRDRFVRLVEELDGGGLDHSALYVELLDLNGARS